MRGFNSRNLGWTGRPILPKHSRFQQRRGAHHGGGGENGPSLNLAGGERPGEPPASARRRRRMCRLQTRPAHADRLRANTFGCKAWAAGSGQQGLSVPFETAGTGKRNRGSPAQVDDKCDGGSFGCTGAGNGNGTEERVRVATRTRDLPARHREHAGPETPFNGRVAESGSRPAGSRDTRRGLKTRRARREPPASVLVRTRFVSGTHPRGRAGPKRYEVRTGPHSRTRP